MINEARKLNFRFEIYHSAIICTLIFFILFTAGCGRKEPPKAGPSGEAGSEKHGGAKSKRPDNVEHRVLSFNLEGMTEKGEKKWEVIGSTAKSISENEVQLGNIVAKTYGKEEAVITADEGIYDKSKNNVRLRKNVMAVIENSGSTLKDQIGFSPFPEDRKPGADAGAAASESGEKKKMTITCDGEVEFDYVNNLAHFNDNVKVKSADGDIDADKITVDLDPDTKKINDIIAQGHVKITQHKDDADGDSVMEDTFTGR